MKWTHDDDLLLRRLHAEGHAFSFIAARIGGITRNAAIGRAARLSLPSRNHSGWKITNRSNHQPKNKKKRKSREAMNIRCGAAKVSPLAALHRDGLPLPPPAETDIPRISHDDVEHGHCRWPCGELGNLQGDTPFFCGEPKIPGLPYCEVHARRAFNPPQPRQRESNFVLRQLQDA